MDNVLQGGNIILNKDDKFFNFLSNIAIRKGLSVISFGQKKQADIFLLKKIKIKNYCRLKVKVKSEIFYFDVKNFANNFI